MASVSATASPLAIVCVAASMAATTALSFGSLKEVPKVRDTNSLSPEINPALNSMLNVPDVIKDLISVSSSSAAVLFSDTICIKSFLCIAGSASARARTDRCSSGRYVAMNLEKTSMLGTKRANVAARRLVPALVSS